MHENKAVVLLEKSNNATHTLRREVNVFFQCQGANSVCLVCMCVLQTLDNAIYNTLQKLEHSPEENNTCGLQSQPRLYTFTHTQSNVCMCTAYQIHYMSYYDTSKVVAPTTFSSSPEYIYNVHVHVQRTCTCIYLLVYTFPYHTFSRHHITGIYM